MLLNNSSNKQKLSALRLIKVFAVLVLFVIARQAPGQSGNNCAADAMTGWQTAYFCGSLFEDGNYVGSYCQSDQFDDPSSNAHIECKQAYDQGQAVCYGTNCSGSEWGGGGGGDPGCTYHGYCQWDGNCCGMNWCDWSTNRCQDPEW